MTWYLLDRKVWIEWQKMAGLSAMFLLYGIIAVNIFLVFGLILAITTLISFLVLLPDELYSDKPYAKVSEKGVR